MIMDTAKKILAAIGFSQYTQNLLNYAVEVAQSMNAELIIASIINARDVNAVGTIASMGYADGRWGGTDAATLGCCWGHHRYSSWLQSDRCHAIPGSGQAD